MRVRRPSATVINITIKSNRLRTGRSEVQFYDKQSDPYEKAARDFPINLRGVYETLLSRHIP